MTNLSIKSKLLAMLLGVSVISIAIVATLSYYSSYQALRGSVYSHLTSLRALKADRIETYFKNLELEAEGIAAGPSTIQAMRDFLTGYRELQNITVSPDWDAQLEKYYSKEFIPRLANRVEGTPTTATYLPQSPASRYLQYRFIAGNRYPAGARQQLQEISDENAYARAHAQHHPQFRRITEKLEYYDLFLIDIETGDIVYSVAKEVDFATNLVDGPYDTSNLAELFRGIQRTPDRGLVRMIDYARYRPSHSRSQAFIAAPIFDEGTAIGVLAIQISNKEINHVMTGGGQWEQHGLGNTGESIAVGPDSLMRSFSRFLIEDPEAYAARMRTMGLQAAKIKLMLEFDSTILIQPVRTTAVGEALRGRAGIGVIEDYRGVDVLASWAPLKVPDFRWAIIAKIDTEEAFAPIRKLARDTLIQTALIMLAITVIVMLLASRFVRPVNELIMRVREAGSGNEDVQIDTTSGDEIGELAGSFQELVTNVRDQTRQLRELNQESERILESVLPSSVAHRLRSGEKDIADSVPDVSVLFAKMHGIMEFCDTVPVDQSVARMNELVSAFDDITGRFGIEKIKTIGDTYMATCGLCSPLLDHTRRAVDFARELQQATRRFNAEHALNLGLTVGISAGPVIAGIVGRDKFIYDVWGNTVVEANIACQQGQPGDIVVTAPVRDKIEDLYGFTELASTDPNLPLWSVSNLDKGSKA